MKRRYRYLLNFLSSGLLLFALYLNFFKKDMADVSATPANSKSSVGTSKQTAKVSAVSHAAQAFHLR